MSPRSRTRSRQGCFDIITSTPAAEAGTFRTRLEVELDGFYPRIMDLQQILNKRSAIGDILTTKKNVDFICTELIAELARVDTTDITLRSFLGRFEEFPGRIKAVQKFMSGFHDSINDKEMSKASNLLSSFRRFHSEDYDRIRARQQRKLRLLWLLGTILLPFVFIWAWLMSIYSELNLFGVTMMGLAGATGATMSGALKLRKELVRTGELREFQAGILAQALFGSAAALFVLLVLDSGFVTIGGAPDENTGAKYAAIGLSLVSLSRSCLE
jgi:hypothetical protein